MIEVFFPLEFSKDSLVCTVETSLSSRGVKGLQNGISNGKHVHQSRLVTCIST